MTHPVMNFFEAQLRMTLQNASLPGAWIEEEATGETEADESAGLPGLSGPSFGIGINRSRSLDPILALLLLLLVLPLLCFSLKAPSNQLLSMYAGFLLLK